MSNSSEMKPSTKEKQNGLFSIGKLGVRGLRIAASTIAIVEILKHDYSVGVSAGVSWLLLTIAFKRIYKDEENN